MKDKFIKIAITLLLIERIIYYVVFQPKFCNWLNFIVEHILELSR